MKKLKKMWKTIKETINFISKNNYLWLAILNIIINYMQKIYAGLKKLHEQYTILDLTINNFIRKYDQIVYYKIFSFSIIGFIFYTRLFIERWPRDLIQFHWSLLLLSSSLIIFNICFLVQKITKLKTVYQQQEATEKSITVSQTIFKIMINRILERFQKFLQAIQENYKQLVLNSIQNITFYNYFFQLGILIHNNIPVKKLYFYIFLLPKFIPILVFFIDVCFFYKICYFYKVLWLYLIPLIGRIFRFTYTSIMEYILKKEKEEFIIITDPLPYDKEEEPYGDEIIQVFEWYFPEQHMHHNLEELKEEYIISRRLYHFYNFLYKLENRGFSIIFNILITVLTLIIWFYIFYISLSFFTNCCAIF